MRPVGRDELEPHGARGLDGEVPVEPLVVSLQQGVAPGYNHVAIQSRSTAAIATFSQHAGYLHNYLLQYSSTKLDILY